jgi:hypothetical protein
MSVSQGSKQGDWSAHSKGRIERLLQRRLAERLEKALNRTVREQPLTDSIIFVSSDKDDWNLMPAKPQFPLQIGSGHARHFDIEEQASRLADAIGHEELFRRRESLDREAEPPE